MKTTLLYLSLTCLFNLSIPAAAQDHNSDRANYTINCTYDPKTRIIDGEMNISWRSVYKKDAGEIQLHLYLNAFSGPNSTFMREYGEYPRSVAERPGYCKIQKIEIYNNDVTESMRVIQPEDNNLQDSTVVSIPIPKPQDIVFQKDPDKPGLLLSAERQQSAGSIPIKIKFRSQLPALLERVGVYEDFIMAAQWFPKLGVLEKDGWKCHTFHANSEFYANFGNYDVSLTIPTDYAVGASGEMIERQLLPNNLQKLQFKAEKVHGFAWCADASMHEQIEIVQDPMKQFPPTRIRLLYQPEHERLIANRIMHAVKNGLYYFESHYGDYPYRYMTVIDAPVFNAVMEYPTLFLTGNFDGYKNPPAPAEPYPDKNLFLERLTLHELGHQWFYGVCANNEAEEAWLDEGLTEYITAKAFEHLYGKVMQLDESGNPLPVRDFRKDRYISNPYVLPSTSKSWEFPNFGDYYIASYVKPKLLFYTLDNVLGEKVMENIFRTFYERFSFRHPIAEDFFQVVEEVAGMDVQEQVIEYLSSSKVYDVGIKGEFKNALVYGKMPSGFPVEYDHNFSPGQGFAKLHSLNLVPYKKINRSQHITVEPRNTFSPKFKQTNESHMEDKKSGVSQSTNISPGYYISLDPDSLIEFDINPSNNSLYFNNSDENN